MFEIKKDEKLNDHPKKLEISGKQLPMPKYRYQESGSGSFSFTAEEKQNFKKTPQQISLQNLKMA